MRSPQRRAVEPPESPWVFPTEPPPKSRRRALVSREPPEVVGVGADLEPGTLLRAYRTGVFPMPAQPGVMAWWSPDPRGILLLDGLRVSRSLRKSCARFEIRVNTAFEEVVDACADLRRPGAWIDADIRAAYIRLHELGWAHSVEAWTAPQLAGEASDGRPAGRGGGGPAGVGEPAGAGGAPQLAGGLYGIAIGGLFAGESMFHRETDASKVALVGLVSLLRAAGEEAGDTGRRLIDVQWATPHLQTLGVIEVPRRDYLARLAEAIRLPQPAVFGG